MLPCKITYLEYLGFGDLIGEDPANTLPARVNIQHDLSRLEAS